jgi:DNA glycosylase AlkZ-like
VLDALATIADAERGIVTEPTVKGDLSTALGKALDPPYLRWCNPCRATHPHEQPFRLAALQAGLELDAGTSPPVLRRVPSMAAPRFRRLAGEADVSHDVIRNHLRFYPGARRRDVAEFVDAPIKVVKAHWPDDAEEVTVTGIGAGKQTDARFVLAADVDALGEVPPCDRIVLVGTYDPYVQLRDRELLTTDADRRKALWPRIGRPGALLADGEVLGTWRPRTAKGALTVVVTPWARLTAERRTKIEAEAERLAAFRAVDLAGVTDA